MNLRRLFLYLLIASIGLSALIGIGVILFGDFGEIEIRVLMTTLTVTATSIFGLACGAYLESGRGKILPLAGIIFSIVASLMCFLIIWNAFDDLPPFIKSFVTATILAAGCSHLSLLSLARLDRRFALTRIVAIVCVITVSAILIYLTWLEPVGDSDLVYRVLGVLGILLASITVVTPVLHKLSSAETNVEALDREIASVKERLHELEAKRARFKDEGVEI